MSSCADPQPADRMEVASIASREVKLEQRLLADKTVIETQLVNSTRKLEALGNLCESLVRPNCRRGLTCSALVYRCAARSAEPFRGPDVATGGSRSANGRS